MLLPGQRRLRATHTGCRHWPSPLTLVLTWTLGHATQLLAEDKDLVLQLPGRLLCRREPPGPGHVPSQLVTGGHGPLSPGPWPPLRATRRGSPSFGGPGRAGPLAHLSPLPLPLLQPSACAQCGQRGEAKKVILLGRRADRCDMERRRWSGRGRARPWEDPPEVSGSEAGREALGDPVPGGTAGGSERRSWRRTDG